MVFVLSFGKQPKNRESVMNDEPNWKIKCFNPNCRRYLTVVLVSDGYCEPDLARLYCQFCDMNFTSKVMNEERKRLQMPKAESWFSKES